MIVRRYLSEHENIMPPAQIMTGLVSFLLLGTVYPASAEPTAFPTSQPNRCLRESIDEIPIGQECNQNTKCVGQPICSNCMGGFCGCLWGLTKEAEDEESGDKVCAGNVRIGGQCDDRYSEVCTGFANGTSSCESGTCQCITGYSHTSDFRSCLPIRHQIGAPCEEDGQCHQGTPGQYSRCFENACSCGTREIGAISVSGEHKCYRIPSNIGDTCEVSVQCQILKSYCVNGICECGEGYVPTPNPPGPDYAFCLEKRDQVGWGQECISNVQCIPNAICQYEVPEIGFCTCDEGYLSSEDNRKCYKLPEAIGDPCIPPEVPEDEDQCRKVISGPVGCNRDTEKCECFSGHVGSSNGKSCLLQNSELNTPCEEDIQCGIQNSNCRESKCQCQENFANKPDDTRYCWEIRREINLPCEDDFQCRAGLGDLAECRDMVCQCKNNYGYYNGQCYIPARLGEACRSTEECIVGVNKLALCVGQNDPDGVGRCHCQPGATERDGKCYSNCECHGCGCKGEL